MEWNKDWIGYYFDGKLFFSIPLNNIHDDGWGAFHKPMNIILNLALDKYGFPVDDRLMPARYEIKYVRVYQKTG